MNKSPNILDPQTVIALLQTQMIKSRFGVKSLALFGSVARNQATAESDLDFMVDFEGMVRL